jgi:hypothetical protein
MKIIHFSGPYQTVTPVFEISSFRGTQQISLLPLISPLLPYYFLPEDEIRTRFRNVVIFNLLAFVSLNLIILK